MVRFVFEPTIMTWFSLLKFFVRAVVLWIQILLEVRCWIFYNWFLFLFGIIELLSVLGTEWKVILFCLYKRIFNKKVSSSDFLSWKNFGLFKFLFFRVVASTYNWSFEEAAPDFWLILFVCFIIFMKTIKNFFYFRVDFVNVLNPRVNLSLRIISVVRELFTTVFAELIF